MNKCIIGVDAAKLAGLQIALLRKLREGQITIGHLEWFLRMTQDDLNELCSQKDRFKQVREFGFVVPGGYCQPIYIDTLLRQYGISVNCADNIVDGDWTGVSNRLIPGARYIVKIFQVLKESSSEHCLAFLRSQGAAFVGIYGLLLAWGLYSSALPEGSIVSLDRKAALLRVTKCTHFIPLLSVGGANAKLNCSLFESGLEGADTFLLCFCRQEK